MELKEFIKTTVQSIVEASRELIAENSKSEYYFNPLVSNTSSDADAIENNGRFLPVTELSFDVAITEEKEKSGSSGGKVKVISFEVGAEGKISAVNSTVSRLAFKLRVALPSQKSPGSSGF